MLLQVPPQVDFSAVLAHRPIIHQEEMGMQIVENIEFAERVQQRLIRSDNLQYEGEEAVIGKRIGERGKTKLLISFVVITNEILRAVSYVSANEIIPVFNDSPGCDPDSANFL